MILQEPVVSRHVRNHRTKQAIGVACHQVAFHRFCPVGDAALERLGRGLHEHAQVEACRRLVQVAA